MRGPSTYPTLTRCEVINILLARQQEFQKADATETAGLIEAKQYQVLSEFGFLDAPADILPVCADALDGILGKIVVPGYVVMLQEGEYPLAVSQETLLQGFGGFGFYRCARVTSSKNAAAALACPWR